MLALSLGCGPPVSAETRAAYADVVVPDDECRAPAPSAVAPDALARDVDVLERVMRRGYAGFELAGDDARWARAFAELRASLPTAPLAPLAFRDLVLEHVGFVDDGHVGLWLYDPRRRWRATTSHQQAYVASARFTRGEEGYVDERDRTVSRCDGREPGEVLVPASEPLPMVQHVPVVLSREPRESIECTFAGGVTETYPLTPLRVSSSRGPAFERLEAPFPWLRLRTLFPDHASELDRFVASAEEVRDAPVIVLDLRRGGGGSDRYLVEWFRRLTSGAIRYWETDALASEVTLQGARTFWGCVRAAGGGDEGGRAWLDARVSRADRELREAMSTRGLFRERERERIEVQGLAPAPFAGRLVLVVDRGCNSACETSVLLARQLRGSIVVGENTEGTMKVGELRWYRLPESRVWISLGMRAHHDPFGRFREGYGYAPDYWLTEGEADARIRAIGECMVHDGCGGELVRAAEIRRGALVRTPRE